jgi:hypothetical protein
MRPIQFSPALRHSAQVLDRGVTGIHASRCSQRGADPFKLTGRKSRAAPDSSEVMTAFPIEVPVVASRTPSVNLRSHGAETGNPSNPHHLT